MNDMHEAVELPDPAVKRLLHPTDLPEAREAYLRGWWFARLSSLPIAVALGAVVWVLSGNPLATIAAPLTTFVVGFVASRWHDARAWDFIPRRRQDRDGAGPWPLLASGLDALALLVTAAAVILAVRGAPVPDGVVAYAVGSGLGVALLQVGEIVAAVARRRSNTSVAQRVMVLVAVITGSASVAVFGPNDGWDRESYVLTAVGMVSMLLAYLLWWSFTRSRRQRGEEEQ